MRMRTGAIGLLAAALLIAGCTGGDDPVDESTGSPSASDGTSDPESSGSGSSSPGGSPTGSDGVRTPPEAALADYYSQQLSWHGCGGDFECAKLRVPRDYAAPGDGDLEISVVRLKAAGDSLGALVINPGGPGGSGVEYARAARAVFTEPVLENFDIVGFDPRGVGDSAAVRCKTSRELDEFIDVDPTPDTSGEEAQFMAAGLGMTQGCEVRSGALLPVVATIDAARDMDVLRAALDEEQLTYLGASYGTYLGAVYADTFPQRVGRFVLDGALDPSLDQEQVILGQTKGFELALQSFLERCKDDDDCPLDDDPGIATGQLRALLEQTDQQPLPTNDSGRPLTESLATLGIAEALYAPEYFYDLLKVALAQALSGNGSGLLQLADFYTRRGPDGDYANLLEANLAINCADRGPGFGVAEVQAALPEFEAASPVFGRGLAWGLATCVEWPVDARQPAAALPAAGAAPILVIGTTRDPATPYEWSQALASQLESGHLLTFDGDGHTAYNRGSKCINDAVEDYLIDGDLPRDGKVCD